MLGQKWFTFLWTQTKIKTLSALYINKQLSVYRHLHNHGQFLRVIVKFS